jgi:chromosomal replication initiation ATPase DnaA
MSKKTQENALRNKLQKLTKRNYRSLGTYIRLVDYMVIEAQVKINQESAEKMLEDMKRDKKYWIITKIKFELEAEG